MTDGQREGIRVEREGAVGWIVLDRPDAINAIDNSIRNGLPEALRDLDADTAVRAIVVRGNGPRGFCAGADLKEAQDGTATSGRLEPGQSTWIEAFDRIAKPVIAAVHGFCLGGGLEIALACDLRFASADARFGLPETRLGLIPGGGGTQRLPRLIGASRALEIMLTGLRIDAAEALRVGLVTRVADSESALLALARDTVERIAAAPPAAIAAAKRAVREGLAAELGSGLALERRLFSELQRSPDRAEALAAFREKRAPRFAGR